MPPLSVPSGIKLPVGRTKPLHPRGVVQHGVLTRTSGDRPSGVAWLDETGRDDVLVRRSRGAGLPSRLPDVQGLAVRLPRPDGYADLLLSSAGLGRVTRFLPVPGWRSDSRPLSTLMPYRGPDGPVLLAALPTGPDTFDLLWATPGSDWVAFGELAISSEEHPHDAQVSFDSFVNPLPGLETYEWTRRLRQPAYRAARWWTGRPARP